MYVLFILAAMIGSIKKGNLQSKIQTSDGTKVLKMNGMTMVKAPDGSSTMSMDDMADNGNMQMQLSTNGDHSTSMQIINGPSQIVQQSIGPDGSFSQILPSKDPQITFLGTIQ